MNKKFKLSVIYSILMIIALGFIMYIINNSITGIAVNAKLEKLGAPTQATATDNVGSGTSGTCKWLIDKDGNLIVWPTNDVEGTLESMPDNNTGAPWYEYREQVKTATFQGSVYGGSSLRGLFYSCTNMTSMDLTGLKTNNVTDMSYMFYGCKKLKKLNLSSFNTSNVTSMSGMFSDLSDLTELDISGFDTNNIEKMENTFQCGNLVKIKIGTNTKFKIDDQTTSTGSFGRGTWVKEEDGKQYSAVEVCQKSLQGTAAGTYTKISNISKDIKIDFPVTYKVQLSSNSLNNFSTNNSEMFEEIDNKIIIKNIPLQDVEDYIVPGKVELLFTDSAIDENEKKYDVKVTIDNVHLYDLKAVSGVEKVVKKFISLSTQGLSFENYFYKTVENLNNNIAFTINSGNVGTKLDVEIKILDEQGNPVEGSYILSAYDLDVPSQRDKNEQYKNSAGTMGYGDYSEGINFIQGFDINEIITSNPTFLIQRGNNRFTGTRYDNSSEFAELIAKADASNSKFQWTMGAIGGTSILTLYQPQIVEFVKLNQNEEIVKGAKLQLFYAESQEPLQEWTSTTEPKKMFLNPGKYTIKEVETPAGYETTEDITFFVDINDKITRDGKTVEKIKVVNEGKNTKVTVHHYIEGTTTPVPLKTGGTATEQTINGKAFDAYETSSANVPDYYELVAVPANATGKMSENEIIVIYYYRLKQYPYTVNYYDKDTNQKIKTTKNGVNTDYGTEITVASEKVNIEKYDYTSSKVGNDETLTALTIGTDVSKNVINLYYTKKKGNVVVKYVDRNTNQEIPGPNNTSLKEEKTDKVDEEYTTVKKTIEGYTYVEDTGNTEGTYTLESVNEPIEVIYYYKKNTKVIVNYIDKATGEKIPEADGSDSTVEQNGLVGDSYTAGAKSFENYVLIEDEKPNPETVTMTEETITLNYYYAHVSGGVIEKHVDDITGEILENKTHQGEEGTPYNIPSKTFEGYELVQSKLPTNATGTMKKDAIEVVYYYKYPSKVTTKYLEENTGEELADDVIKNGYNGENYTTNQKEFEGYELVSVPLNATGTMTKDEITVIYTYRKKKYPYTVNYYDKDTNQKIKTTKNGEETDYKKEIAVESEKVNIEKYDYTSSKVGNDETLTALTIGTDASKNVINLYYTKKKGNVVVKYIDRNTNQEIPGPNNTSLKEEKTDKVDEEYTTVKKTIEGYTYVEDTGNTEGTYTLESVNEPIEVIYYYKKNTKVIVNYIDKATGEKIPEADGSDSTVEQNGLVGDTYVASSKSFTDYILLENEKPNPETVTMTEETITLNYYYAHVSGGVIEKHVDDITGEILENKTHQGEEGTPYNIPSKTFEGYELVQSKLPTNATGTMKKDAIEVVYYYKYPTKVIAKYVDKETGEEIEVQEEKKGYNGEDYETKEKEIKNYKLVEKPNNGTGTMTKQEIVVTYYYERKETKVEVQYLEEGTEKELLPKETINGKIGDNYKTEKKDIEYYELIQVPENANGIMEEKEKTVKYYYKAKPFNLKVDKWIDKVEVNGVVRGSRSYDKKDEIYKLEINRKKITNTEVKVTYKIRVTNDGEVEGYVGTIIEQIPSGFKYEKEDNTKDWKELDDKLITTELEKTKIEPGKYEEVEITLKWKQQGENFGGKVNIASISNISNPKGFKETKTEDNKSEATILLSVATGVDGRNKNLIIFISIGILLIMVSGIIVLRRKIENKK